MRKTISPFAWLAGFAILVVLTGCTTKTTVSASTSQATGISVSGTGRASGAPDIVTLQIGVQIEARTVADARDQAASAAQAVIDSVKKNGVDDKDIRTTSFNVSPQYNTTPGGGVSTIRAYRVSNSLSVKVRKLDNASKVIDDASAAG